MICQTTKDTKNTDNLGNESSSKPYAIHSQILYIYAELKDVVQIISNGDSEYTENNEYDNLTFNLNIPYYLLDSFSILSDNKEEDKSKEVVEDKEPKGAKAKKEKAKPAKKATKKSKKKEKNWRFI